VLPSGVIPFVTPARSRCDGYHILDPGHSYKIVAGSIPECALTEGIISLRCAHLPARFSNPVLSRQPHVLLAEDDPVLRSIVQRWLTRWGYDTITAADGQEAWQILCQKNSPKLVLLDWSMPSMNGVDLCRRLRDNQPDYYPYVLMITARNNKEDVAHALESGADDYLAKPFDAPELKARLAVADRMINLQDDLIAIREEFRLQATKDPLTGLFNRAAFEDLLGRELSRGVRTHSPTGLLALDVDRFKMVNDTWGHAAGDKVLTEIGRRLKSNVRPYDWVSRQGGEEFCIALPNCSEAEVAPRAEWIRLAIANEPICIGGTSLQVTVSVGAVVTIPDETVSASELIAVADIALYRAKNAGRNCAVLCGICPSELITRRGPLASRCGGCKHVEACLIREIPWSGGETMNIASGDGDEKFTSSTRGPGVEPAPQCLLPLSG